mmetsp:Transcript_12307/g.39407  ORF Transcript_12307/g.39407 Transcript_12307/m.39407 type:complete len:225 (+) Transcript_12307:1-675(+)
MREHPDLSIVLRQIFSQLEADTWTLLVVCGSGNEAHAREAVDQLPGAHVRRLEHADLAPEAYAALRRSEVLLEMVEEVGGEVVLFCECDSVLVRPGAERFLDFDLVGAPWSWAVLKGSPVCVGNGGLCLRRVSFMRAALRHLGTTPEGRVGAAHHPRNEDMSFAQAAYELGARVPDVNTAASFSVETLFHPAPVGCHKPWQYLLPSDLQRVLGLGSAEEFVPVD